MMIGYEMSGVILSMGDRYVIKAMIGDAQLGLYSAAVNMSQYIGSAIIYSFSSAMMPVYMRMASQEGREKASEFTSQSLGHYLLLVTPVIAGVTSVVAVPSDHPRLGQVRSRRRRAAVGDWRHGA